MKHKIKEILIIGAIAVVSVMVVKWVLEKLSSKDKSGTVLKLASKL